MEGNYSTLSASHPSSLHYFFALFAADRPIIIYHAESGKGVRKGHCQKNQIERFAETQILLPNVREAMS